MNSFTIYKEYYELITLLNEKDQQELLLAIVKYMFEDIEKCAKKIKKSQRLTDYEAAIEELFATKSLIKGAGLFRNA